MAKYSRLQPMKANPIIVFTLALSTSMLADPSEKKTAWPDAPPGFHWDQLGPRTTIIDTASYPILGYVAPHGSDETGDGTSTRPWRTIARALATNTNDERVAILVAAGIYREDTLDMVSGVDLFGGFDPQDWTRDIFAHATILSGGESGRVLVGADDCNIDGFIIEAGSYRGNGGALYCESTSPVITNNVFRRNRTLEPTGFTHDETRRRMRGHDGGAIGLVNYANADIRNNLFLENETEIGYGGAIGASHDCIPVIAHNVFWANRAGVNDRNNTLSGNGGAVSLLFSSRAAVFHNLFAENDALGGSDGGALFMEYFCWPEVRHNAFVNNHAGDDGGGLDNQKFSYPKLHANLFYGNRADGSGGGFHLDDAVIDMENNIFAYNRAEKQAGGFGGTHGWYRALNNTVAHNEAGQDGGGLHIVNVKNPFLRPSVFRNNLFAFNEPEQVLMEGEVDATYNIMHPGGSKAGYYNFDHAPEFQDDGLELEVLAVHKNPATFTTTFVVENAASEGSLVGRIIRIGTFWSMVKSNTADAIDVWGLLQDKPATNLEILQTFHLSPASRAVCNGVYPDFAPVDIDGEPRYTPDVDIGADEYHATPLSPR